MKTYKQCELKNGKRQSHGWIETSGAYVGATFKMKMDGEGEWEEGWSVVKVYDQIVATQEQLDNKRHSLKHHRSVTDI